MGAYHVGFKDIIMAGGFTLGILALLSIYSIAVIFQRYYYYRKAVGPLSGFVAKLRKLVESGRLNDAVALCKSQEGPAAEVVMASLRGASGKEERRAAADRALGRQVALLERGLPALGTIGSTAPFIGLFGTVLGVMRAFRDLAGAANAGPGVVAVGISEALVATAAGLFVAIPAIIAYNYFTTRANRFSDEHLKLMVAIAHQAALAVEDTSYYSAMVQAERLAAIGQTIATLSHHIKNILQGIRGGSYLIEEGLRTQDSGVVRSPTNSAGSFRPRPRTCRCPQHPSPPCPSTPSASPSGPVPRSSRNYATGSPATSSAPAMPATSTRDPASTGSTCTARP